MLRTGPLPHVNGKVLLQKQREHRLATVVFLPPVYYQAIVSNLAIAIRPKYGIGTFPGDLLPKAAQRGLSVIRKGSTQIKNIQMPAEIIRSGNYNIFSDQSY